LTPRITIGKGITGAVNYARGEGRDPVTLELKTLAPGEQSRVEFFGGVGFGFSIATAEDVELARQMMEFAAQNQRGKCRLDCVHLSLSWRPGEQPSRAHMQEQVAAALAAIGMANARALYFAHRDEDYPHIHIVASKINPDTGYAYDLKGNYLQLSSWAQRYEADHGGIVSLRRAINNELRAAIHARDAAAVLEALTKQRPTFTAAALETALAKQIKDQDQRREFAGRILSHHTIIALADAPAGPTTRYTTRAVLEAEHYVRRAAANLHNGHAHGIDHAQRAAILTDERFRHLTEEQTRAFRHATGAEGLALIDGQAGTGKSFTLAAVRTAYEAARCTVIGLGPTNSVAEDLKADGFGHAATIHSELFALNNGRRQWDPKTVVIVDEAAMIDTRLMAMLAAWASDTRAKLILAGDDRQLSSIDHGGMFGALKDRYGAAELSEVKRQYKHDERRASEMMAEGNFHDALHIYDAKGAIHWTRTQGEARAQLVAQWAKDTAAEPAKTRFVLAYTNDDVNLLNAALRAVREGRAELGPGHEFDTAHGSFSVAVGDHIQFTGTDKKQGIHNSRTGTIEAIDGTHIAVTLAGRKPKTINFDARRFDKFRHGYAGTVYKAQGKTLDQTYLYHSEHWRRAASYVALTRHREQTALFVARNTAKDIRKLARQMSRTDERRAASMFYHAAQIETPPLTASEILARFSAAAAPRNKPTKNAAAGQGTIQSRDPPAAKHPKRKPLRNTIKDVARVSQAITTESFASAANDQDAYQEITATDLAPRPPAPVHAVKYDDEFDLSSRHESIASTGPIGTDSPAGREAVADHKPPPKAGLSRAIRQLFRQAAKILTGRETDPPAPRKSRRRSGEETGSRFFPPAPQTFRNAASALMSRSRSIVCRVFMCDAFDLPDPCNPIDPAWQPLIENHPPCDGIFDDHQLSPEWPSPNL
jgi:AAA domain/Relaxase/Mobilisation nuclease domain